MESDAQAHNDKLMKRGYEILCRCKEESIACFLWGGGAIYHMLGGKLDYRKMSDLEFLLPKKADNRLQQLLEEMGFIPYTMFNNMQNMYSMPRREFYLPSRELSKAEIEDIKQGRRKNIKDVEFQKIELFIDGIRMCWSFKLKELPKSYTTSLICPPGFQLALKANPMHPDDFDLKDIQDISNVLNNPNCNIEMWDTIFEEPYLEKNIEFSIGTHIFERLSNSKFHFPLILIRNFTEAFNYPILSKIGKPKLLELINFLNPFKEKDTRSGFLSKLLVRKEKPVRVDIRTR